MSGKKEKIYMAVTADKYELPVHVTTTRRELARIYGMQENNVGAYITRGTIRLKDNVKFVVVNV